MERSAATVIWTRLHIDKPKVGGKGEGTVAADQAARRARGRAVRHGGELRELSHIDPFIFANIEKNDGFAQGCRRAKTAQPLQRREYSVLPPALGGDPHSYSLMRPV